MIKLLLIFFLSASLVSTVAVTKVDATPDANPTTNTAQPDLPTTPPDTPEVVDASSLEGKVIFGYQAWFYTPSDRYNLSWNHWSSGAEMNSSTIRVDGWPDVSEYPDVTLTETNLTFANGTKAKLYAGTHPAVIDLHFKWMQDYGLDGVFQQRFLSNLNDQRVFSSRNNNSINVMKSAEKWGRVFALEYDISGWIGDDYLYNNITADWTYIITNLKITESKQYLKQNGKPVVGIFGIGLAKGNITVNGYIRVIDWFHSKGVYVMGGLPYYWRTGISDSLPGYDAAYDRLDAISPWHVGRGVENTWTLRLNKQTIPDKQRTDSKNQVYGPVVYAGFSWYNMKLHATPFNEIPRYGGRFLWSQLSGIMNRLPRNKTFIYVAMFDEVDEGTALYKHASTAADAPVGTSFLTADVDGQPYPNDRYLNLIGQATTLFRNASANDVVSMAPGLLGPHAIPIVDLYTSPDGEFINAGYQLVTTDPLLENQCIYSPNRKFGLCLHKTGELTQKNLTSNATLWSSGVAPDTKPGPYSCNIQPDANLVVRAGNGAAVFAAQGSSIWTRANTSQTTNPYHVNVQNDGNLIVLDSANKVSSQAIIKK